MIDYLTHNFNPNKFNITMTILVKNEVDIIEENIKTHAKLGVDSFVIMDNNSNDGTREKLSELQNQFDMLIIDEKGYYQQKKFMTRIAFEAKKTYKPDWIINSDADEFWIPNDGKSLKEHINFKGGVLRVNRSNMIPPMESLTEKFAFFDSRYQVVNQINYRTNLVEDVSILLGQTSRKVMTNPNGLIKINSGNHSAEHLAFWNKKEAQNIHIYHYPIRSFAQFKKRIITRKHVLENFPKVKMGDHYRRWVKKYNEGKLEDEYKKFIYNDKELELLIKIGVVSKNNLPSGIIVR